MSTRATRKDPLHALDDEQRVQVFLRLIGDPKVRKQARTIAEELLKGISVDEVAEDVSGAISRADVDEVYAHSGRTADGYVDPYEYAREYLEEQIEPFLEALERRRREGRFEEARAVCMGIILGLYEHRDSTAGTDEVLGLDPEFPDEGAQIAYDLYRTGERYPTKRTKTKSAGVPPLPQEFWDRIPGWSRRGFE